MNKNIKVEFLTDKFKDYKGEEREFTLAAVSVPLGWTDEMWVPDHESFNGTYFESDRPMNIEKYLLIGMSIRNAEDKYDDALGKQIAVGKALKFKGKQIVVSHAGLINTKVVKALLEQEAEYFKRDPQSYIAGYNNAAKKWKENHLLLQA